MKYCLSARQSYDVLKKADEIKIELRDYQSIPEYIEKFPDKTLILELENNLPKDFKWEDIMAYSDLMEGRFICALSDLSMSLECELRKIAFYYKYPATTLFEVKGLKDLGVCYILVGTPLMFDLKTVSNYKVPLRAIPNLAYEPYIEHQNGLIGGWVRPEDIEVYGEYIDVFEFYAPKALDKEKALFHIYAEKGCWNGNLNLLIDYLNLDLDNRLIYDKENFAKRRISCKQKCLTGTCFFCVNQLFFQENVLNKYAEYKD